LGLARAASDERPIGEALIAEDLHARPTWPTQGLYGPRVGAALAGGIRGALVAATPYDDSRRACSTASGRRPVATTALPAASAALAMSTPIPRPAPVTSQTFLSVSDIVMSSFMGGRYTLDSISLADLSPSQTRRLGRGRGRSPMALPLRKAAGMPDPWQRYPRYAPYCVEGFFSEVRRYSVLGSPPIALRI
jgi:hypothetical protein